MKTTTNDPLLRDILEKIEFCLLQEDEPGTHFDSADLTKDEAYKAFDVANTKILERNVDLCDLELLRTPRLSTLAIGYIINRLVRAMPEHLAYLNIGVWCGFSLVAGMKGNPSKHCIGVDNFSDPRGTKPIFERQYGLFKTPNARFYEMDYLKYFDAVHQEPLGVYFYDGDHSYSNQLQGLQRADPYLAPGSYVLVDDTNTQAPRDATNDFVARSNGGYSLVLDATTANNGHPTFWDGLMIIKKAA